MATSHAAEAQLMRLSVRIEWSDGTVDEIEGSPPREARYSLDLQPDRRTLNFTLEMKGVTAVRCNSTEALTKPRAGRG